MPVKHTLGKKERLKSRKVIQQLFQGGKTFRQFPFQVFYVFEPAPEPDLKAGFGVSSRSFRKAVHRNRIKRLAREAYRIEKGMLKTTLETRNKKLALFLIYVGKELPEQAFVTKKIQLILQRLIKMINEEPAPSI